jgi:hypothetical protein
MNGKLDITAKDRDGDGSPDEWRISFTVGKAVLVIAISAIASALGYQVL